MSSTSSGSSLAPPRDVAHRIIGWQACDGGWTGRGPSGALWTVHLHHKDWLLANDDCAALAQAPTARPLIDAAMFSEATWLAANGGALRSLTLELLLKTRAFAIAQRESLIGEMRFAGFDPTGMEGPCADWMKREITDAQRAIDALEREAVDRGWRPTMGS